MARSRTDGKNQVWKNGFGSVCGTRYNDIHSSPLEMLDTREERDKIYRCKSPQTPLVPQSPVKPPLLHPQPQTPEYDTILTRGILWSVGFHASNPFRCKCALHFTTLCTYRINRLSTTITSKYTISTVGNIHALNIYAVYALPSLSATLGTAIIAKQLITTPQMALTHTARSSPRSLRRLPRRKSAASKTRKAPAKVKK